MLKGVPKIGVPRVGRLSIGRPRFVYGGLGIDLLAPGVPTLVDLATGSDTGVSSIDNITSVTTPDIIIDFATALLENDVVELRDNGVTSVSHTVTALEAGGVNITLGLVFIEGVHVLQVRHVRGVHSSGWSASLVLTVDTSGPVISTASTANNAENSVLSISLTANESVVWTITGGADQARFEISGTTLRWASNGTKDFEAPNDADTNNTYVVQVTATDTAGNATNKTITVTVTDVDEVAPTVSSLSFTSSAGADNTYIAGDVVTVGVVFSEAVTVAGGTPTITLVCGASNKTASYTSGSGGTTLTFSYTIQAGDIDTDGLAVTANTLALGGATIRDAAANNATLTHVAITNNASHKVDTTAPLMNGTLTPADDATGASLTNNLTAVFSEAITFGATVNIAIKKTSDDSTFAAYTASDIGGAISISSATLTINPASDLVASTGYYVTIDATSIKDLSGNFFAGVSAKTTWNFTTGVGGTTFALAISGHSENAVGGTPITFTAVAMGAADANRVSVAAFEWRDNPGVGTITSVTIDGISATQVSGAATSNASLTSSDIWYADTKSPGNTSTSGNVVVNFSNSPTRVAVALYRVVTATVAPTAAVATSGGGTGLTTASLTIPSGGGALAIYGNRNAGTGSVVWTNATGDYTVTAIGGTFAVGGAKVTATGTITASITSGNAADSLSAAAWGS